MRRHDISRRTWVAQANIAAYETSRRHPSPTMWARLLAATRVRPSEVLDLHRDEVRQLVRRHHGLDVRVFGSVARGEGSPDSDVDLLVRFDDTVTLFDIADMTAELEELLGCRVDIVDEAGLQAAVVPAWSDVLRDIVEFGQLADDLVKGGRSAFDGDVQLQLAGEAVSRLPEQLVSGDPQIPFRQAKAARNLIAHQYHQVNPAVLWRTLEVSVPDFARQVARLLAE